MSRVRLYPGSPSVYRFFKRFNAASLNRNWRIDGEGLDRLESFDRGVIAINHGHIVDGTVLMPLVRRRILFLVDARALDAPVLGHALRAMGVLRVDTARADPAAALIAARAARRGQLLGVFPEGRVSDASGLRAARSGVALLAARLDLPVLPVAMWGLEAFDRPLDVYVRRTRPTIHVRVGQELLIEGPRRDSAAVRAAADGVMLRIAEMLPEARRGVYSEGTRREARGHRAIEAGWVRDSTPPTSQTSTGRGFSRRLL
jgi:1-acyl-sn-glycerol-3-phosphate acyltransferase